MLKLWLVPVQRTPTLPQCENFIEFVEEGLQQLVDADDLQCASDF